jgi:hypothetical protein
MPTTYAVLLLPLRQNTNVDNEDSEPVALMSKRKACELIHDFLILRQNLFTIEFSIGSVSQIDCGSPGNGSVVMSRDSSAAVIMAPSVVRRSGRVRVICNVISRLAAHACVCDSDTFLSTRRRVLPGLSKLSASERLIG